MLLLTVKKYCFELTPYGTILIDGLLVTEILLKNIVR
jgi:hypothetical protein